MPKRPTASNDVAAAQDDSLVVHPATQAPDMFTDMSPASAESGSTAQVDSQGFWEAEAILDETRTKYLISWKGTDENGSPWKPTWEPKENANSHLVDSWKGHGRAQRKAAKQREAEERQQRKVAKRAAKAARRERLVTLASSAESPSLSVEIEVAPTRNASKRKMVVPESDASSQPSHLGQKKAKEAELPKPQLAQHKKHVAFDIILSDADDEDDEEQDLRTVRQGHETTEEIADKVMEVDAGVSSGSTAASIIPDSQVASPLNGHRAARPTQSSMRSPATSHSDLDGHTSDCDDDVAIFDPLQHNYDNRTFSAEPEPRIHLRPVPIPAVSAFQLADSMLIRSSQLDPIEDPDSSPRRPPVRGQQSDLSPRYANSLPRPPKSHLELVSADHNDVTSPVSSFELEVQSAAAASYVSLPMYSDNCAIFPPEVPALASLMRSQRQARVVPQAVKRPAALPPARPVLLDLGDGVAVRVAMRESSPADGYESTGTDHSDDGNRQLEFFDEVFDFDGGLTVSQPGLQLGQDKRSTADGPQQDAGEGYPTYSGYAGSGTNGGGRPPPQQPYQQSQSQPQPSSQQGGSAGYGYPSAPAIPGGYGFGSAPGYPGGGFPPILPSPFTHGHAVARQAPPKRDYEESAEEVNKKARTEYAPQHTSYPAAAHTHSPYSNMLPSISSPYAAIPSQPQQPYSHPGSYSPQALSRPPALNIHAAPQGAALASPSLARVQSQDPFSQQRATPPASTASPIVPPTSLSSPLAAPAASHRSPSPLPPIAPATVTGPASPSLPANAAGSFISRNSSPAPGAGKADEVIALVRSSPHIAENDETKIEIERFLRDPKAYSAVPTAPLMRSEFWAFELRHVTVDSVEKVDFIILRTHQSTFQLKRAVAGKVPVDFARSLAHSLTRPRGLTPAVEAVPTLAASAPPRPPPPPAPATMTRDQLEQEVEQVRQQALNMETELASLRPLVAENAKLKAECQTLTKTNKSLVASRESAQSDLSYMQAQYQAASGAAVERANEARVAEAEAVKLRGLLDTGLKQKELAYAGQIKTLKTEYARLKQQSRHYQEESKRTQERGIREKAAKWDEHVARLASERDDTEKASLGQSAESDSSSGGEDADIKVQPADESVGQEPSTLDTSAVLAAQSQLPSHIPAEAVGLEAPDLVHPLPAALDAAMPASLALSTPESTTPSGIDFRCEWRTGDDSQAQPCGASKASKESLQQHLLQDHLQQ